MGKNNSSIMRVAPLAQYIQDNPDFVSELLALLDRKDIEFGKYSEICYSQKGSNKEKALAPTKDHLIGILNQIRTDEVCNNYARKSAENVKNSEIKEKRLKYIRGEISKETAITECMNNQKWTVLETETKPDLFIEGKEYILVVEGKLTEKDITTHTTYLPERDQMIRHIQGALQYAQGKGKKVLAFFIISEEWSEKKKKKLGKDDFIKRLEQESVPIEDEKAKEAIISSYIGYTTWKKVEETIQKRNPSFRFPPIQ